MHFLSKILHDSVDESVHRAFLRYGKGKYQGPSAEISVARSGKVKVRSTYRYQDLIGAVFTTLVPVESMKISGIVLGYQPLDEVMATLGFQMEPFKKKPRTLLFQSKIAGNYPVKQIVPLYSEIAEDAYVFCNLETDRYWTHKSKTKMPSAQKELEISEQLKFSRTKIPAGSEFVPALLQQLVPDFVDDISLDFSLLRIENTYDIQNLIFPPNMKQLTSKEIRLKTQRSGILHRRLLVDDKEFASQHKMIV